MKKYYRIYDNKLTIVDSNCNAIADQTATVMYRKLLNFAIKQPGACKPAVYTIVVSAGGAAGLPMEIRGEHIIMLSPFVAKTGKTNKTTASFASIEYPNKPSYFVSTAGVVSAIVDPVFMTLGDTVDFADIVAGTYTLVLAKDLWSEQDDGNEDDIQTAAIYLLLSRVSDLAGGDRDSSKYFFEKYNFMKKDLRKKYNSAKYSNITIKPFTY